MLRFNDGVEIDTSGDYRPLKLKDGWYVVGHGLCIPVASHAAALAEIKTLTKDALKSAAPEAAIRTLRDAQQAARKTVAEWAAQQNGRRDPAAAAILELLADCGGDANGDATLNAISSVFEEFGKLLPPDVIKQLEELADSAHDVGRQRGVRYVE